MCTNTGDKENLEAQKDIQHKKIKIKGKYYNIYITKLVHASVKMMNPMLHAALLWQVEDHLPAC